MDSQHEYAVYGPAGPLPEIGGRTAWHTAVSVGPGLASVTVIRTHPPDPGTADRTYRPARLVWRGEEVERRSAGGGSDGRVSESTETFTVPGGPLPGVVGLTVHAADGTPHTVWLDRL
ncbi:hypothetical protein ACIRBX_26835 [Kitasatospora sp. NPDC096147]|uniref:hypothetical protein n=1 Tax=Kitasatospora sp. NPDC096147 TaxID=3364093 RepID=UPI0038303C2D